VGWHGELLWINPHWCSLAHLGVVDFNHHLDECGQAEPASFFRFRSDAQYQAVLSIVARRHKHPQRS
jgi:hypothetical protein